MKHPAPPGPSELFRVLLRLQRAYALAQARFRHGLGLNDTDLRAVDLLRSMQTPSPGQLARELGVSSAGITAVLDRLEARQIICRQLHASDRRRTVVARGENFPRAAGPGLALLRSMHSFCAQLDEPARCALSSLLEETRAELDRAQSTPGRTPSAPKKSLE